MPDDQGWALSMRLGDHWYPVPLDVEPGEYEAYVVEVLVEDSEAETGRQMSREVAEAIGAEFRTMAEIAIKSDATGLSLYRPVYDAPMVATFRSHVGPPVTLADLEEWVTQEAESGSLAHDVSTVSLPAGDAVRVWASVTAPGPEAVVTETLTYYVAAPDDAVVRLELAWTDATYSASLVEWMEEALSRLSFRALDPAER